MCWPMDQVRERTRLCAKKCEDGCRDVETVAVRKLRFMSPRSTRGSSSSTVVESVMSSSPAVLEDDICLLPNPDVRVHAEHVNEFDFSDRPET